MLKRLALTAVAVAALGLGVMAVPASADPCPNPLPDGSCPGEWEDDDPGDPPDEDDDPGDDGGGGGEQVCYDPSWFDGDVVQEIPCVNEMGMVWYQDLACYLGDVISPRWPYSDPEWEGNTEGDLYPCQGYQMPYSDIIWLPAPPEVVVDPGEAARRVIARMVFKPVDIEIAPRTSDDGKTVVGAPVWMWNGSPDDRQRWGPYEVSESESGLSVSVSAQVEKVVWAMGDGSSVTCTTPGTPFPAGGTAGEESPDCGHRYLTTSNSSAGGVHTVTATSYWVIDWSAGGTTGTEHVEVEDSVQLPVGEVQVIVE